MGSARRNQPDLFEAAPVTDLRPDLRSKLAPLLQSLLAEAAGMLRQSTVVDLSEGAGDDQDHA